MSLSKAIKGPGKGSPGVPRVRKDPKLRFLSKVEKGPDCWTWTGYKRKYGNFGWPGGEIIGAHRASYLLFVGPIPPGLVVMHLCDNGDCVRPDHLRVGTQQENITDMIRKGRQRHPDRSGEKNSRAKLTTQDVLAIRSIREPDAAMARIYGVSVSSIRGIRAFRSWKHVA